MLQMEVFVISSVAVHVQQTGGPRAVSRHWAGHDLFPGGGRDREARGGGGVAKGYRR